MPSFVLYPLAVLGLLTVLAFAVLLVLLLVDRSRAKTDVRAAHRRTSV